MDEQELPEGQPEVAHTPHPMGDLRDAIRPANPAINEAENAPRGILVEDRPDERVERRNEGMPMEPAPAIDGGSNGGRRKVTIESVNFGFIVKVGCHTFALEQPATVADNLKDYLTDPHATEKKWFAGELFKKS